jgi:hypothetical protein
MKSPQSNSLTLPVSAESPELESKPNLSAGGDAANHVKEPCLLLLHSPHTLRTEEQVNQTWKERLSYLTMLSTEMHLTYASEKRKKVMNGRFFVTNVIYH